MALGAELERGGGTHQHAVGDDDIFDRLHRPVAAPGGFEHDAIVAGLDVAVGDDYVARRIDVDAVAIDRPQIVEQRDAADAHVVAVLRVDRPGRRVAHGDVVNPDAAGVPDFNERAGARQRFHLRVEKEVTLPVDGTAALDGDVFDALREDEVLRVVVGNCGAAEEHGAGREVQRDIALQEDRA